MSFTVVRLPPKSEAELERLMTELDAWSQPLQSLATSELTTAPEKGDGFVNAALRWWAGNPNADEDMAVGRPLVWWAAGTRNQMIAVVMLPNPAGPGDGWVLSMLLQKTGGAWRPAAGAWHGAAHYAPRHPDEPEAALLPVPAEWIARETDEHGRDNAVLRAIACTQTMDHLTSDGLSADDGAFGAAWAAWREDGRGRGPRSDAEYVTLAVRYFARTQTSLSPIEDLAAQMRKSPIAVRKALSKARQRGLLSPALPGRAGGSLTTEGTIVLARLLDDLARAFHG